MVALLLLLKRMRLICILYNKIRQNNINLNIIVEYISLRLCEEEDWEIKLKFSLSIDFHLIRIIITKHHIW